MSSFAINVIMCFSFNYVGLEVLTFPPFPPSTRKFLIQLCRFGRRDKAAKAGVSHKSFSSNYVGLEVVYHHLLSFFYFCFSSNYVGLEMIEWI